jgi:hypothetical protein
LITLYGRTAEEFKPIGLVAWLTPTRGLQFQMALFCKDRIAQRVACPFSPVDGKFCLFSRTLLSPLACAIGHTSPAFHGLQFVLLFPRALEEQPLLL